MDKGGRVAGEEGVFTVSCNWTSSDEPIPDSCFVVQSESSENQLAADVPVTAFRGKSAFTTQFTFKRRIGRCHIAAESNARVVEVYGAKVNSSIDRFLFTLSGKKTPAGLYQAVTPQPRAIPQHVTKLKIKLLSLQPDRKGPCNVRFICITVPPEALGPKVTPTSKSVPASGLPTTAKLEQAGRIGTVPSVALPNTSGTNGMLGMLMQCESGISRRILQKCEELVAQRTKSMLSDVQKAVGSFDREALLIV